MKYRRRSIYETGELRYIRWTKRAQPLSKADKAALKKQQQSVRKEASQKYKRWIKKDSKQKKSKKALVKMVSEVGKEEEEKYRKWAEKKSKEEMLLFYRGLE